MPSYAELPRGEEGRPRRVPRASSRASTDGCRVARRQALTGTLEEGQVRAMFDRIAGVYDVMNSVMTAGLHHRWRERAADLAARRPGRPGARRGHRHRRPGDRAGAPRRPGGEVVGSDFSEGMLERARAEGSRRSRWEQGNALALPYADDALRRRDRRLRRAQLLRPRPRAGARWRGSCGPGGRVVVLEITTPQRAAAVDVLLAVVRPRRAAARAGRRRGPRPTRTCRAR